MYVCVCVVCVCGCVCVVCGCVRGVYVCSVCECVWCVYVWCVRVCVVCAGVCVCVWCVCVCVRILAFVVWHTNRIFSELYYMVLCGLSVAVSANSHNVL